jgi:methionine synthase II (cobalamin-independent)
MSRHVHLVGSVGLDGPMAVYEAIGQQLWSHLKRVPDGEPGGRRMWISWQYPVLRANPYLKPDVATTSSSATSSARMLLRLADGVRPEEVHFGELGYAREARASYEDFCEARSAEILPAHVRFQVSLPTPYAVTIVNSRPEDFPAIETAYEKAMLSEVLDLCRHIPLDDLCIQWDVCLEMVQYDGFHAFPVPSDMESFFGARFNKLAQAVPEQVELGFHLCYGDLDGKHFIEPKDTTKMVGMANLIKSNVHRRVDYIHMPVPIARHDDSFFAPLRDLKLGEDTELYLGLVHSKDGIDGTIARMQAAKKFVSDFGVSSECGIARAKPDVVIDEILRVTAQAARL